MKEMALNVVAKVTFSRSFWWMMGAMFSFGYVQPSLAQSFRPSLGRIIIFYCMWPIFLGAAISGKSLW